MADAEKEDDPSIEEILDSIRQIITDDDDDNAADDDAVEAIADDNEDVAAEDPVDDASDADTDEEIVELTDKVVPDEDVDLGDDDDIMIDMMDSSEDEPTVKEKSPPTSAKSDPSADGNIEHVLADAAEQATLDAFSDLARTALVERSGQVTLEDVVRQEVRPLLKSWLNTHLPGIVERLLEKELQRISNRFLDN